LIVSPSFSFASVVVGSATANTWTAASCEPSTCAYTGVSYTGSQYCEPTGGAGIGQGSTYYRPVSFIIMDCVDNLWVQRCTLSGNYYYASNPVTLTDPSALPGYPCTPEGPDCTSERASLADQCGGDSNIMNWDDQECTGECKPDCAEAYTNLLTACGGQKYIAWFDDETCLGECVTCEDVQAYCESLGLNTSDPAVFQCTDEGYLETSPPASGGGLEIGQYWHIGIDAEETCGFDSGFDPDAPGPPDPLPDPYPPEPDPPADRPCDDLRSDCYEVCDGKVNAFVCTEGGTYRCECSVDTPTDPTPNPGDPGETPPETGTDPPAGTPGGDPGTPDGTNDNEILGKISVNTKGIADNTKRIGDINQGEFNKLNATAEDIKNGIGEGNTMLKQIEAAENKGNGYLKDIEKNTAKIENNTDGIEGLLGDIKETNQKIADNSEMEQSALDSIISSGTSDLESAYNDEVAGMQSSVQNTVGSIPSPDSADFDFLPDIFDSIIPSTPSCQDLDLSFFDKEIIIYCSDVAPFRQLLEYFFYICTMLTIGMMFFREMRPNA